MKQPLLNINKPQPPLVVEKMITNVIWNLPKKEKVVYLTFDDGPVPKYTEWVLDLLDTYNVKATFFCVGDNVVKHRDIFNEILKRGHEVGSHTHNHLNGWLTTNSRYYYNTHKGAKHVGSKLFRPPYGKIKRSQARRLSQEYKIVMWDVLTKDYDPSITGEKCFENVKNYVRNGSIIVFHDSAKAFKNYEYALPKTIEYLLEKGYIFEKLTD